MHRSLAVLALCLLLPAGVFAPDEAAAQSGGGSVVQDSCLTAGSGAHLVYASVVNHGLPSPICALSFIPEPRPVRPDCYILQCIAPPGWACFLNPLGGADFFANTLADCIADGSKKTVQGFYCIAEERLYELPGDVLASLNQAGYLQPVFMAVASLSRMRDIIERRNRLQL